MTGLFSSGGYNLASQYNLADRDPRNNTRDGYAPLSFADGFATRKQVGAPSLFGTTSDSSSSNNNGGGLFGTTKPADNNNNRGCSIFGTTKPADNNMNRGCSIFGTTKPDQGLSGFGGFDVKNSSDKNRAIFSLNINTANTATPNLAALSSLQASMPSPNCTQEYLYNCAKVYANKCKEMLSGTLDKTRSRTNKIGHISPETEQYMCDARKRGVQLLEQNHETGQTRFPNITCFILVIRLGDNVRLGKLRGKFDRDTLIFAECDDGKETLIDQMCSLLGGSIGCLYAFTDPINYRESQRLTVNLLTGPLPTATVGPLTVALFCSKGTQFVFAKDSEGILRNLLTEQPIDVPSQPKSTDSCELEQPPKLAGYDTIEKYMRAARDRAQTLIEGGRTVEDKPIHESDITAICGLVDDKLLFRLPQAGTIFDSPGGPTQTKIMDVDLSKWRTLFAFTDPVHTDVHQNDPTFYIRPSDYPGFQTFTSIEYQKYCRIGPLLIFSISRKENPSNNPTEVLLVCNSDSNTDFVDHMELYNKHVEHDPLINVLTGSKLDFSLQTTPWN